MAKEKVLRIKGHALSHSRSGVQSLTAVGSCACGQWRTTSTSRFVVEVSYRTHLRLMQMRAEKASAPTASVASLAMAICDRA